MPRAEIIEQGNGLAGAGEYVAGDDGQVYVITDELGGRIRTGPAGCGNRYDALVELAHWSDVSDDDEPYCSATISEDEGEADA